MVLFTKAVSTIKPRRHFTFTHPLLVPTFPAVTSTNPHNVQRLIEAHQSQGAMHGEIITPQFTASDVPRSIATIPRNVPGATGVLPQFVSPATTSLSRSVVGSTSHISTPHIDILANTAQLGTGSPTSPSCPLPVQRESGTPTTETSSPALRIANITNGDTTRSTSSSSISCATPFQPSRFTSDPSSPVHVVLENTTDLPLHFEAPRVASASAPGTMGCNDVSELPRHHPLPHVIGQQSTSSQEPSIQPLPQPTIIPPLSSPSKMRTRGASYLGQPIQPIQPTSHQTSVHPVNTFAGDRSAEQDNVNTPVPPWVIPIDFPEPSHFLNWFVQTPVQGAIPLSPDTHPYPHFTTPSSLRPRSALSLIASPGHVRQNFLLLPGR